MILLVFTIDEPKRRQYIIMCCRNILRATPPVRPSITAPMAFCPVTAAAGQEASILILSGTSFPEQVPVRSRSALALV